MLASGVAMAPVGDKELEARLDEIRSVHGDMVAVADVADVVHSLLSTVSGDVSAADLRLYEELSSLAEYINEARGEIAALRPDEIRSDFIPSATDELDAIVGATEHATNGILDAVEQVEAIMGEIGGDLAERLGNVTCAIYEACNFQDLTGQRITKVVRLLKVIEERISTIVKVFGDEITPPKGDEEKQILSDSDLLNGPQLPENATDQAEIDRLLAEL